MIKIRANSILTGLTLLALSHPSFSDQVILDDLIVSGSLCVGSACTDNEAFDFDTVIYKSDDPEVRFQDTSSSAAFPTSDWALGFTDEGSTVIPYFYLRDMDSAKTLLILESGNTGGVAIGAGSTLESNAISVGSSDHLRKVMFVVDGTADSDAATMGQFNAFASKAGAIVTADISNLEGDVTILQASLLELKTRLEKLATRIDALNP
jgi:hypothetical protein